MYFGAPNSPSLSCVPLEIWRHLLTSHTAHDGNQLSLIPQFVLTQVHSLFQCVVSFLDIKCRKQQ
jgi:hypothetical protein